MKAKGIHLAAVSYDSVDLLQHFSQRAGISYPLISDPESRMIRAFGILNENFQRDHQWYGVPFPGTYLIDETGKVAAKYFEQDHRERFTASNVIYRQLGLESGTTMGEVETPHLEIRYSASDRVVRSGSRTVLILDVVLGPGLHVYAPEVGGSYIPIDWSLSENGSFLPYDTQYPDSENLHLPAVQETLPVYSGTIRLTRDLTIGQGREIRPFLSAEGKLTVEGSFRYQACDDKFCYPPKTIPIQWVFDVERHDTERAPESLRRKKD
jgi:hypothetical protein